MQQAIQEEPRRISAVVRHTGISKELVHHYIRQGLLPKSESRARYSEQQVRLLQQVRTLREDHNLPLELIRRLFSIFDFEPDRIESLTLSDSLSKRIGQFAQDGDLSSSKRLSADELIRETGVTRERLAEYEKTRLVAPLDQSEPCFGAYDVNVVSLCEHGVRLGIPFDAFRTIGSYVGIAFDLAHSEFYEVSADRALDADRILADLFVRRELASSFVQNVLAGLTQRRMQGLLQQASLGRVRCFCGSMG